MTTDQWPAITLLDVIRGQEYIAYTMDELLGLPRRAKVALHQSSTRRDTSQVQALLHEYFLEFGGSGSPMFGTFRSLG